MGRLFAILFMLAPAVALAQGIFIGNPGEMPPTQEEQQAAKAKAVKDLKTMGSLADGKKGTAAAAKSSMRFTVPAPEARPAAAPKTALPLNLKALEEDNSAIRGARIVVHGKDAQTTKTINLSWELTQVEAVIFLSKLQKLEPPVLTPNPPPSRTAYTYLSVELKDEKGQYYEPITLYANTVTLPRGKGILGDKDRDMELWLFGTAKTYDDRVAASKQLDVMSFHDCLLMGYDIIETTPRQCIIPDGTTFLEVNEKMTEADLKVRDFDSCVDMKTNPIINTFPRKCVAPGGRVYVEPPRLRRGAQ